MPRPKPKTENKQAADDKRVPNDLAAEQSVLGAVLCDPDAWHTAVSIIRTDDFYRQAHRTIWDAMRAVIDAEQTVDIVLLTERLRAEATLDQCGGPAYLSQLIDIVPTAANIARYAEVVRENAVRRAMIREAYTLAGSARDTMVPVDASLSNAIERQIALAMRGTNGSVTLRDAADAALADLMRRQEHPGQIHGVPTGWNSLDRYLDGFQPHHLVILKAASSVGKTSFALATIRNMLAQGIPCLFFSLEMNEQEILQRLIAMGSGAPMHRMRAGTLTDEEWNVVTAILAEITDWPLWIETNPDVTPAMIVNVARKMVRQHQIRMIVVDYLQDIVPSGEHQTLEQETAAAAKAMRSMAKELGVPVMLLSQVNDAGETRNSRAVFHKADVELAIQCGFDGMGNRWQQERVVVITKQRQGPLGRVKFRFHQSCQRWEDVGIVGMDAEDPAPAQRMRPRGPGE